MTPTVTLLKGKNNIFEISFSAFKTMLEDYDLIEINSDNHNEIVYVYQPNKILIGISEIIATHHMNGIEIKNISVNIY